MENWMSLKEIKKLALEGNTRMATIYSDYEFGGIQGATKIQEHTTENFEVQTFINVGEV